VFEFGVGQVAMEDPQVVTALQSPNDGGSWDMRITLNPDRRPQRVEADFHAPALS
jgi:hypothetical protein